MVIRGVAVGTELIASLDKKLLTVYSGKRNQEFPNLFLLDVMRTQFYDLLFCPSTLFYLFFYFGFCILNKFTHSKPKIWLLLMILQTTVFLWQVYIFLSPLDHDFNIFSSNSDRLYSDQSHETSLQRLTKTLRLLGL